MVSALTVFTLREIGQRRPRAEVSEPSVATAIWNGWRFIGRNPVVRGIVIGLVGAFAAAGVIVGLGRSYVTYTLHGGDAGWGVVFSAIFVGIALGMLVGLRVLRGFSRRRLFGLTIGFAAAMLVLIALIPNLVVVTILVVALGSCAGTAYVTGYTIIGLEVDDDTRGRTFAFLQSAIRVILFAVIPVAAVLAAGLSAAVRATTGSATVRLGNVRYADVGINFVLLLGAAVALVLGIVSYRQMDDRRGVPLLADLASAFRGEPFLPGPVARAYQRQPAGREKRAAARAGGRRGSGQVHPGPAAGHLAARPGLRRGGHAGAGRDQGRDAAARPAARHRAYRPVSPI